MLSGFAFTCIGFGPFYSLTCFLPDRPWQETPCSGLGLESPHRSLCSSLHCVDDCLSCCTVLHISWPRSHLTSRYQALLCLHKGKCNTQVCAVLVWAGTLWPLQRLQDTPHKHKRFLYHLVHYRQHMKVRLHQINIIIKVLDLFTSAPAIWYVVLYAEKEVLYLCLIF